MTDAASRKIADCMRRLVRGHQPSEFGGASSGFNITAAILQELIDVALQNNQNKKEIFDKDGLKPITAALDPNYGDEINSLAADLIGLIAEYSEEMARCCAAYRQDGIRSVQEILLRRSHSHVMRVRTSAKAALYSLNISPQIENQLDISQPMSNETSIRSNAVALQEPLAIREIFEGEVADDIFRSLAHELGHEWQSLATQLKIPYQSISKLQTDAPHNASQQCFKMLREHFFNRNCGGLTDSEIKARLKQGLQHRTVGRNDLVDKLDVIIAEAMERKMNDDYENR